MSDPRSSRTPPTRRDFLGRAAAAAVALSLPTASARARSHRSLEALRIGVVGLRGRGGDHVAGFAQLPDVRITALCDCDRDVLDKRAAAAQKLGATPALFQDVRKLLDARIVDAIAVATPNHWHAMLGVWACERGLDAYIEKPISHDLWEGQQLVAASKRHGRVVAGGTQSRSNPGMQAAIAYVQSGALGKLLLARGLCYKRRGSIGKVTADQPPPQHCDYELWLGPAAQQPVRRQQFHYDWHWQWDFGNGDLGNQGVHQMDLCRWAVGQDRLPARTLSVGGRLGYDDDGQTPNTQIVWLGYEPAPVLFEVRGLPDKSGSDQMDKYLGTDVGVVFHCEHGVVVMPSYDSGYAQDDKGQKVQEFKGGGDHFANFVAAVRARDSKLLAADAQQGHLSAALCHLGNDSYRQGTVASADAVVAALKDQPQLGEAFGRMREHLGNNGIELATGSPLRLGKLLTLTADTKFTPREYRAGFALKA